MVDRVVEERGKPEQRSLSVVAPFQPGYPIRRAAGFLASPQFEGTDDQLLFRVEYPDNQGVRHAINFRCTPSGSEPQEMCIANNSPDYTVTKLSRDTIVSHLRMASIISKTIPGSKEWVDALLSTSDLDAKYFQMPVGQVRLISWSMVDDRTMKMEFQRGTTTDKVFHEVDLNEITAESYIYAPSTQLMVISGSVERQFPNYHHNYPDTILSEQQRQDIIDYVASLELWI